MAYIKMPDAECLIAERPGVRLYMGDMREDYPLYRNIRLITEAPFIRARRSAHMVWIVHLARLRGGGDCWILEQHNPELRQWIESECAKVFDAQYVMDTFGLDAAEYADLVRTETDKYNK